MMTNLSPMMTRSKLDRLKLVISLTTLLLVILNVDAQADYSLVDQSCENVIVNLDSSSSSEGIIHSPNYIDQSTLYNKSQTCSWSVVAPVDHEIQLVFVDIQVPDCTSLVVLSNDSDIQINSDRVSMLSACHIGSFASVRILGNRFTLAFSSPQASSSFLIYFKSNAKTEPRQECNQADELSCQSEYSVNGQSFTQTYCIKNRLVCNCGWLKNLTLTDSCEYLTKNFGSSNTDSCSTLSTINRQCLSQKAEKSAVVERVLTGQETTTESTTDQPAWLPYCSNVFRTNEFGWLASPNLYSGPANNSQLNYPPGLNCTYHIIMQPYQTIQIRLKYFYLNSQPIGVIPSDRMPPPPPMPSGQPHSGFIQPVVEDYDSISIYDGPSTASPLIVRLSSLQNDYDRYLAARTFNSKSNIVLIVFHSASMPTPPTSGRGRSGRAKANGLPNFQKQLGFNLTYQIKGFCIEDQKPCNSLYELNCFSPQQVCNDVWDCQNGADERGCEPCKADQFKCRNHIFCFRADERCDGDHQCMDKSDELGCDKWQCNPDNGTFLCANGRCIYEQWQCDGTVDCEDGSDELNCPSTFSTRRVITTAVLGGTLCCLLLVMALGCACKLYSLHTISYRSSMRFSHHHQTASSASTQPLMPTGFSSDLISGLGFSTAAASPRPATSGSGSSSGSNRNHQRSSRVQTIFRRLLRRRAGPVNQSRGQHSRSSANSTLLSGFNSMTAAGQAPIGSPNHQTNQAATSLLNSPVGNPPSHDQPSSGTGANENETTAMMQILPPPHHLIAPPTYNQTMGLVDEYEQRQLAFLEHVRTILSQQQQQQQPGGTGNNSTATTLTGMNGAATITSISLIPTVSSSSTTVVHRQTQRGPVSSSSRRSHRHHRHHRHHRSINDHQQPGSSNIEVANSDPDNSNRPVGSSRHRHHNRHVRSSGGNTASLTRQQAQFSYPFEQSATSNQESDAPSANSMSFGNLPPLLLNSSNNGTSSTNGNQNAVIISSGLSRVSGDNATTSSATGSASANSTSNNPLNTSSSASSANLRDKIAKLIKDIVVNNNAGSTASGEYEAIPSSAQAFVAASSTTAAPMAIAEPALSMVEMDQFANLPSTHHNRRPTTASANTHSSSGSSFNNNEDDVPLIQP